MEKFIKELQKINGTKVIINTSHEWFGKEKYKCEFCLINDKTKLGFKLLGNEIYLLKTEIKSFNIIDKVFYIKDSLMEICIQNT